MSAKPTIENRIIAVLTPLIAECKKEIYLKEYQEQTTDTEVLGVIVAKFLKWEGTPIIKALLYALEDANYHKLETKIEELTGINI